MSKPSLSDSRFSARFTRRQLFEVVADINSYPSFVPYCKHVSILSPPTRLSTDGTTVEEASMTVGFLGFTESYTSRVTSRPHEYVEVCYIHHILEKYVC
jgi:coenzyme Q-binding protein COQ10